jgi:Carboxypeptidase regulatory-like domain
MRKAAAAGVILVLLVGASGCTASEAATGTVQGVVVLSPPCPVEMTPVEPSATPSPGAPGDECGGSAPEATVRAFRAGTDTVEATVRTEDDGRFTCDLPEGDYTLEAVPASPGAGQGVPLDVTVEADSIVEVTLRIDTGVL